MRMIDACVCEWVYHMFIDISASKRIALKSRLNSNKCVQTEPKLLWDWWSTHFDVNAHAQCILQSSLRIRTPIFTPKELFTASRHRSLRIFIMLSQHSIAIYARLLGKILLFFSNFTRKGLKMYSLSIKLLELPNQCDPNFAINQEYVTWRFVVFLNSVLWWSGNGRVRFLSHVRLLR